MGSSAQNSSGVNWCRCRVSFNEVPEKVPKVPEKVWEALVQSQFKRVPEKEIWEALVHSQVRFNRVPKKVPEKVPGGFGAEPGQVQQGSGEASGEGLGGFGAEPGQVSTGFRRSFRRRSGRLWCKARSGSTGFRRRFRRRFREALVQSQLRWYG